MLTFFIIWPLFPEWEALSSLASKLSVSSKFQGSNLRLMVIGQDETIFPIRNAIVVEGLLDKSQRNVFAKQRVDRTDRHPFCVLFQASVRLQARLLLRVCFLCSPRGVLHRILF